MPIIYEKDKIKLLGKIGHTAIYTLIAKGLTTLFMLVALDSGLGFFVRGDD